MSPTRLTSMVPGPAARSAAYWTDSSLASGRQQSEAYLLRPLALPLRLRAHVQSPVLVLPPPGSALKDLP